MRILKPILLLLLVLALVFSPAITFAVEQHWVIPTLEKWHMLGFITNPSLVPVDKPVTRGEMARYINTTYFLKEKADISAYKDIPVSHPYYNDIAIAVKAGYISGSGDRISPDAYLTRAELSTILCRVLKLTNTGKISVELKALKDYSAIPGWARSWMSLAKEYGFISDNNGYIGPLDKVTHAQAIQAIDNTLFKTQVYATQNNTIYYTSVAFSSGNLLKDSIFHGNLTINVNTKTPIYLENLEVKGTLIINTEAPVYLQRCTINSLKTANVKEVNVSIGMSVVTSLITQIPSAIVIDEYTHISVAQFDNTTRFSGKGTIERVTINTTTGYVIDPGVRVEYPILGTISPTQPMQSWLAEQYSLKIPSITMPELDWATIDLNPPLPVFFPVNGSEEIATDTAITVSFTEPIRIVSASPLNDIFMLYDGDGNRIPCTVTRTNNVFSLVPTESLTKDQAYMVCIQTNAISDLKGNKLYAANSTFLTETTPDTILTPRDIIAPEAIYNFEPTVAVPQNHVFEITFNEPVELVEGVDITESIFISDVKTGVSVPITVVWDANAQKITVTPSAPLTTDTDYYLTIRNYIFQDQAGNKSFALTTGFKVH